MIDIKEEACRVLHNCETRAGWIYQEIGEEGRISHDRAVAAKWNTRLDLLDAAKVIRAMLGDRA